MSEAEKPIYTKGWFWCLIIVLISFVMASTAGDDEEPTEPATEVTANMEPTEDELQASYRATMLNEYQSYAQLSVHGTLSSDRYQSTVDVLNMQAQLITGNSKQLYTKLAESVAQDDFERAKRIYLKLGGTDFEELHYQPLPKKVTFHANGTFAVNDEIKPGLYRAESISYWARLSGFSGELKDILVNATGGEHHYGPAVVEIKKTDAGFQTIGTGEWTLIDDSYMPEKRREFGGGIYIVGKDIEPGTYKSSGTITYWSRLKNFTWDEDSILANATPVGTEIVNIKSSDTGFITIGEGTWKRIK